MELVKKENTVRNEVILEMVANYQKELKIGLEIISKFEELESIKIEKYSGIVGLEITDKKSNRISIYKGNENKKDYAESVNRNYWRALLEGGALYESMPYSMKKDVTNRCLKLAEVPFTYENVLKEIYDTEQLINLSLNDFLLQTFDSLSYDVAFSGYNGNEYSNYRDRWKTNKPFQIGKKTIINPRNRYSISTAHITRDAIDWLKDIEKALDIIAPEKEGEDVSTACLDYQGTHRETTLPLGTKGIECRHFVIDTMKKGSFHLKWKDLSTVEKYNQWVYGQRKWIA